MRRTGFETTRAARMLAGVLTLAGWQASAACELEGPSAEPPSSFPGFGTASVAPAPPLPSGAPVLGTLPSTELIGPVMRADSRPPPISGGTLFAASGGSKLVAADPDRDAVYVIDVATLSLERRVALQAGDEPGRVAQDAAGQIHVALRGGRSLVTFALTEGAVPRRSEVCALPRGLAYDAKRDHLYVACAEGVLVQVDPATGARQRQIELGRDLRDVVVHGDDIFVTRFRSAELLQLDAESGIVRDVRTPPTFSTDITSAVLPTPLPAFPNANPTQMRGAEAFPALSAVSEVAWRAVDLPGRGVVMLHQRAQVGAVRVSEGGYGAGASCTSSIVAGALTVDAGPGLGSTFSLATAGLHVDVAVDATGTRFAVANPGAWGSRPGVQLYRTAPGDTRFAANTVQASCLGSESELGTTGQVTSVVFVRPELLAAQQREPASIMFYDLTRMTASLLDLQQPSRDDSGHAMFHVAAGAGLACASCHPEAGDDGHVWTFDVVGRRRTQSLRGGILGTEPFHWNGDMRDFSMLVDEVFVKRMAGLRPSVERAAALADWIDGQPALHAGVPDAAAVERGRTLFESDALLCAKCHAGERFTNNKTEFVGTGEPLQVPSLVGVSFRLPLLHDGCAPTLEARFGACGGGEKHGHTAQLSAKELGDLTAFLSSL